MNTLWVRYTYGHSSRSKSVSCRERAKQATWHKLGDFATTFALRKAVTQAVADKRIGADNITVLPHGEKPVD